MASKLYLRQKLNIKNSDPSDIEDLKKIDIRYTFEGCVYMLFHINLENLIFNKVVLCKDPFSLQPSEIDRMYYWEYEYFMKSMNKRINDENKEQQEQYEGMGDMNPNRMMKNMQKNATPQMPKMPNINMNMSMPKF